ncbi:MAG: gamma-glutamyl-gamma-aminobutyrate hydrolase family protein [Patescibacteria group bacterium]
MEKILIEESKKSEYIVEQEKLQELEVAKEKTDARVEILQRHKILFFSCVESGSYEKVIYNSENIPQELKDKIKNGITANDSKWFEKGLGWDNTENRERLQTVNAISEIHNYPEMGEISGIIIGGSPHMVGEDEEWMKTLQEYIRIAANKNIPLLGVCFGHQMIAKAFGGKVEKTPQREFGTVQIDLTDEGAKDELFRDLPTRLDVLMSHSDSVSEIDTETIKSLALNKHNINQVIKVGDNVRGIQFHPELTKEILEAVAIIRAEVIKNEGLNIEQIVRNLKNAPEAQRVLKNFDKYFVFKYSQSKK